MIYLSSKYLDSVVLNIVFFISLNENRENYRIISVSDFIVK